MFGMEQLCTFKRKGTITVLLCVNATATNHDNWWLVRVTYVVDGLVLGDFFWKVVGS